jgi:hypothetical protein
MSALVCDGRSTDPLISVFEDEQKTTVFSALSEYLGQNLFCDVTLMVGPQILRAHKVVLASSSKFFYNIFNHFPGKSLKNYGAVFLLTYRHFIICHYYLALSNLDLERELAPHGLTVTFDDVRLIIGILYCVGTVEISPQRVETLLLIAQVMGIPSLIRFLKKIRESIITDDNNAQVVRRASLSPMKRPTQAFVYVLPPSAATATTSSGNRQQVETRSLTFEQHSSTSFFHHQSRKVLPEQATNQLSGLEDETTSPPSRSVSRATLASLSSFSFNPISSPALREANEASSNPQILDTLDPSFLNQLNNLQANQIDDLENALLPHLQSTENHHNETTSIQFHKKQTAKSNDHQDNNTDNAGRFDQSDLNQVDDSFNTSADDNNVRPSTTSLDIPKQELLTLLGTTATSAEDLPNSCSTPKWTSGTLNLTLSNNDTIANYGIIPVTSSTSSSVLQTTSPGSIRTINQEQFCQLLPTTTGDSLNIDPVRLKPNSETSEKTVNEELGQSSNDLEIDEDTLYDEDAGGNDDNNAEAEFKIPLSHKESKEGKSITLTLPGSSKSVTVNFSADALNKMRRSVMQKQDQDQDMVKKKSQFSCQLCSKSFLSQRLLAKHEKYHVDKTTSCRQCGQVFTQKWKLEQHLAKDHGLGGRALECKDCGKEFKWHRNLLAHINLNHQREVRYRCKNCPLTFLKKKAFMNHHRDKHLEAPEPWCKLCFEVFDGLKQREDHNCGKIENTGKSTICHKHDPPLEFRFQADLLAHIKKHHSSKVEDLNGLQKACPVCHKKFLLRKNLVTHMQRFHEHEGKKSSKHHCQYCGKSFFYEAEKSAHENTHTGQKNFKCDQCEKAYSSKKALLDHNKIIHPAEIVVHSCQICGKKLRDKYKLKYHMMVHSEKRNFKCSHCSVEFKGGENLRKHMAKFHHGNNKETIVTV